MADPIISILIPCYNARDVVGRAIRSALVQDYSNLEVLVLDDGSNDDSVSAIRAFDSDSRFKWFRRQNKGGNATRNELLSRCTGEYVQFLDADDELHPQKVSTCVSALLSEDVQMVFTDYLECSGSALHLAKQEQPGSNLIAYFTRNSIRILTPLHQRKHLLDFGGFDERLPCCQEFELHLRLARFCWRSVARIPRALCTVHRMTGSVSSNESRVFATKSKLLQELFLAMKDTERQNPESKQAIAEVLHYCCRHLARHAMDAEAMEAYNLAIKISPTTRPPAKWPVRLLSRCVGPVKAERFTESLRRMLT